MGESVKTGGEKEFHYSKKDIKEIESEDTHSTREFKEALRGHYRGKEKENERKKKLIKNLVIVIIIIIIILFILKKKGII